MSSPLGEDGTTNINVCLRIRPQNDMERRGKHSNVIFAASDTEVKIVQTSASIQQQQQQQRIADKIFTFDHVFGPSSTQEHVFNVIAEPIVDQVLRLGVDGSILSYGPTGSGKTYTMGSHCSGNNDPNIGIIPRCVNMIFDRLQSQGSEFSIKVSFLELYNEDLIDLLSDDVITKPLRIYDDPKTGTMIQNLDEMHVSNPQDVFKLLQKAQQRRHVAETNLNVQSSRSHTIFTITTHIKDIQDNEELFRSGKLHLVDLAGAENVSKSGAVDMRQKEAGKINVSLLALGRVITKLVQKEMAVPFRESKLTRILKDSFTRSKTCIIATVSPSQASVDESTNTIDYAYRAKSIKNKVQANERVTQKHYFRDLVNTISRLKAECAALRSKNGIYLPPEQYQELTDGYELQKAELGEVRQQLEASKFDLSGKSLEISAHTDIASIITRQSNLNAQQLLVARAKLMATKRELYDTEQLYHEESYYSQKLQQTEAALHSEGSALISTVETVATDNDRLFEKIERQAGQEQRNLGLIDEYKVEALATLEDICNGLGESDQRLAQDHAQAAGMINDHCAVLALALDESGEQMTQWNQNLLAQKEAELAANQALLTRFSAQSQQFQAQLTQKTQEHIDALATARNDAVGDIRTAEQLVLVSTGEIQSHTHAHMAHSKQSHDALSQLVQDHRGTVLASVKLLDGNIHRSEAGMAALVEGSSNALASSSQAQVSQLDAMLQHQTAFQATTKDQFDSLIAQETRHEASQLAALAAMTTQTNTDFSANVTSLNTINQTINQHCTKLDQRVAGIDQEARQYNQRFTEAISDLSQTLSTQHTANLGLLDAQASSNAAWFVNYEQHIAELQTEQKRQFAWVQNQQQGLKRDIETFQTNMTAKLNADSAQLLQSITALVQGFVTAQQAEVTQQTSAFMGQVESVSAQLLADQAENTKQYEAKVNQLHFTAHRNNAQQLEAWRQHEQAHFSQASQRVTSLSESHQAHDSAIHTDHIAPLKVQVEADLALYADQMTQLSTQLSSQHHANSQSLQAHVASTQSQTAQRVGAAKDFSQIQNSGNYAVSTKNLADLKSQEQRLLNERQAQLTAIANHSTATHQSVLAHSKEDVCRANTFHGVVSEALSGAAHTHQAHHTTALELNNALSSNMRATAGKIAERCEANNARLSTFVETQIAAPSVAHHTQAREELGQFVDALSAQHQSQMTSIDDFVSSQEQTNNQVLGHNSGFQSAILAQVSAQTDAGLKANKSTVENVAQLTTNLQVLTAEQLQKYRPTGETPIKKAHRYPSVLSKTHTKDHIVQQYRDQYQARQGPVFTTATGTIVEGDESLGESNGDTTSPLDISLFNINAALAQDETGALVDDVRIVSPSQRDLTLVADSLQARNPVQFDENQQPIPQQPLTTDEVLAQHGYCTSSSSTTVPADSSPGSTISQKTLSNKDLANFRLLSSLPKPAMAPFSYISTVHINEDVIDEADNAAKTHTTTVTVDQNAQLAQLRAQMLTGADLVYIDPQKTAAVFNLDVRHNATVVGLDDIQGHSQPVMATTCRQPQQQATIQDCTSSEDSFPLENESTDAPEQASDVDFENTDEEPFEFEAHEDGEDAGAQDTADTTAAADDTIPSVADCEESPESSSTLSSVPDINSISQPRASPVPLTPSPSGLSTAPAFPPLPRPTPLTKIEPLPRPILTPQPSSSSQPLRTPTAAVPLPRPAGLTSTARPIAVQSGAPSAPRPSAVGFARQPLPPGPGPGARLGKVAPSSDNIPSIPAPRTKIPTVPSGLPGSTIPSSRLGTARTNAAPGSSIPGSRSVLPPTGPGRR